MKSYVLFSLLMFSVLLFGCTSSEVKKATSTPEGNQIANTQQAVATSTPEIKTVKVAKVGEALTNGNLKITLNAVEFKDTIETGNQYTDATAKDGKTFAIVDVTIDNTGAEAEAISSVVQFSVKDTVDGYAYNMDMLSTIALKQQVDGKIQPGDKVRGKVAFEVPKKANPLQFVFDFGLIDRAQAKFEIGNPV